MDRVLIERVFGVRVEGLIVEGPRPSYWGRERGQSIGGDGGVKVEVSHFSFSPPPRLKTLAFLNLTGGKAPYGAS